MRRFWIATAVVVCCCFQPAYERTPPPAPARADEHSAAPAAPAGPAAGSTRAPNDTRPVIACFGDSLTAGFGLDPGQSFPDLLQRDLDARGLHYRVANLGVSGYTTQDAIEQLSQVEAQKPAIVSLELGGTTELRGQPVSRTGTSLPQRISRLQNT